ncbi:MAG: MATE family efflux transporter [Thermomicrobiales bacterium]|nr:MATE family efflux transporter [Thermomicrobiales bacterium]MCO5220851.1 MATE family efflux transporter [Thermomicrobiales bacterium]
MTEPALELAAEATQQPLPGSAWEPMTQRRVLLLALPIIGENMLQVAVGAVDTLLVGRLGADAIAGVGIAFETVFLIIAILSAVTIGATVLVSQAIGAGASERANELARQAISWGVVLAIPLSILGYVLAPQAISLFHVEDDVAANAVEYLQITSACSVAILLSYLCGAVLRGAGDSRTPLKAAVLANAVNVVVAYVLIFGHFGFPELGVGGSAWGAALGRATGAAFMLVMLWSGKVSLSIRSRRGWFPSLTIGRGLFKLGLPAAFEQVVMQFGFIFLVAIAATIGTDALAAQQISFTAMSIAFLPTIAFATTATAFVGQSVGAKRMDEGIAAANISRKWAVIVTVAGLVLMVVFAEYIVRAFSDDANVIELGTVAMRAIGISLPIWGLWMSSAGAVRGAGDTRSPMIRGVVAVWLAVLIAWIGVQFLDQSIAWIWGSFIVTGLIPAIGNWRAFKSRAADLTREFRLDQSTEPTPETAI